MKIAKILKEITILATILFMVSLIISVLFKLHSYSVMALISFFIALLCSYIVERIEQKQQQHGSIR